METKVKVNGFENTQKNNEILRRIVEILYPLTSNVENIEKIEVGKTFSIMPFSKKTEEEIAAEIEKLMRIYSEKPF